MATSAQRNGGTGDDKLAALTRAYSAIVNEARAQVAAGREPTLSALEKRLRAATKRERSTGDAERNSAIDQAESRALEQLERVATVYRARALLTRETAPAPAPAAGPSPPSLRSKLKTRPTITGNMDVRRESGGDALTLTWETTPAIAGWEVRFSERPDPRGDYVVRETLNLPATATSVDVPLGQHLFRVNILGRSRDGRLLRRALISSLTRETWNERWERRASAS